jgi:hypothetical protein
MAREEWTGEENVSSKGGERALKSEKVSAAQIQVYLKGMDYPANREEIIQRAEENNAPENVMKFLRQLPERQYERPNHVQQEFGRMK